MNILLHFAVLILIAARHPKMTIFLTAAALGALWMMRRPF